ncbi:MAG: DUF484 family protein [Gammaproteobacteria bacterium]|jgi:uncharacterized protein YigA (DUF484 family)
MSSERKAGAQANPVDEAAVADYLARHPDFFEKHPDLAGRLRIPHESGPAISLIEKQVAILRQQNRQLERKLVDLIEVARANDALVDRIHHLAVALVEATDLTEVIGATHECLRQRFGADEVSICLFREPAEGPVGSARVVNPESADLKPFANFLKTGKPLCGHLRAPQLTFLFGDRAPRVGSAALLPLGPHAELGMLAVGSSHAEHFSPTLSTVFLSRMGELIASVLKQHLGRNG